VQDLLVLKVPLDLLALQARKVPLAQQVLLVRQARQGRLQRWPN
jgi:hypothetical protein